MAEVVSAARDESPAARPRELPWREPGLIVAILGYLWLTYYFAHGSLYLQGLILVAAVFAILAVSLDLVAGMVGLYSLGHAGLFALGAYGTTLLYNDRQWNLFVLLPVSMIGVGAVGLVLGALSLRVSGLYFAITTFIFTLVVDVLASDLKLTGGFGGLIGPIFPEFPSWLSWLGESVIWCSMIALLVAMLLCLGIRRSPLYPVLLAIRDAEPYAEAAGARTALIKIGMFGLSAAMAGAAGWIFTFQGIVSPGQFSWSVSVNILVMVILGGMNTTIGPVLGAAFVTIFPAEVNINPFWQEILFGALFIAVIIVYPAGFVGFVKAVAAWALRLVVPARKRTQPVLEPPAIGERPPPASGTSAEEVHGVAVECRDLVFAYTRGTPVLNGVDFVVRAGSIHGLIGPNGSGKTTLVDLVAGRLRPLSGTITVNDRRLEREGPSARARNGFMRTFQAPVLVRELTVLENVGVGLYTQVPRLAWRAPAWPALPGARRDGRRMRATAREATHHIGVHEWNKSRVASTPHGVQQLTQLAAASSPSPRIVILDEPLAGLSPSEVEHVGTILSDLKAQGVSVILIEHQPRFVFALCDEVTVLDAGEVVAAGAAADVRVDRRVREVYLGQ